MRIVIGADVGPYGAMLVRSYGALVIDKLPPPLTHVTVASGVWQLFGMNAFGLSLLPLLIGVGILFFNGRSTAGWLLTIVGAAIILAGILMNMSIYFRPTSLFDTLIMLILMAGGLGFIMRSLKAQSGDAV